jgi:hypothetical protein
MSELLRRQWIFAECMAKWLFWVHVVKGWRITFAEGYIGDSIDKPSEDTPHKRNGNHFNRLAGDYNLWAYDGSKWVLLRNGNEPQWLEAGAYWKSLNPLCRWGGDFGDANHLSVESPEGMK